MSRKFAIGMMLVMLCMGLGLVFFTICVMTPDFQWHWGAYAIFIALAIGFFVGAYELEQIDKILRRQDRLRANQEHRETVLPDWRTPNDPGGVP